MSKIALIAFAMFRSQLATDVPPGSQQLDGEFYRNDLVVELTIECQQKPGGKTNYGVISFSKIDKLFCTPSADCFRSPQKAISQSCR
ncbi:hypothetical protein MNBD_ALPHA08-1555 [hydrothermal vent metagenome]|uniref:Uncharacterized protein n=1 Tax=hydrothermal vent metagenome TaxID=652676 RepID=A0A3B0R786_9ZZZZ